jgi:GT2 family glycosyltransferase
MAERVARATPCGALALPPATCDVSVIIVSYNTRDRLRACLRSIEQSLDRPSIEVFVVDNASADGSADMVAQEAPWVMLVRSPVNGGYAYANNIAIKRARGRSLLLLNPDTELEGTALRGLLADLDAHPDVGAVGPKLVREDGSLDLACRRTFPTPSVSFYRMAGLSRLFSRSRRFGRYNMTYLDPDEEADVDALSGACMLARREAVEHAGLLDERFFMYGEDLDWALRIKSAGWRIRYNPKVVVLHHKGEASRQSSERATVAFYEAMYLFYAKHYRGETPLPLDWLIVAAIYGRMAWSLARNALRPPEQRRVTT